MVEPAALHADADFTRCAFLRFFTVVGDNDEILLKQVVVSTRVFRAVSIDDFLARSDEFLTFFERLCVIF